MKMKCQGVSYIVFFVELVPSIHSSSLSPEDSVIEKKISSVFCDGGKTYPFTCDVVRLYLYGKLCYCLHELLKA